jgi:hypothetical protein
MKEKQHLRDRIHRLTAERVAGMDGDIERRLRADRKALRRMEAAKVSEEVWGEEKPKGRR